MFRAGLILIEVPVLLLPRTRVPLVFGVMVELLRVPVVLVRTRVPVLLFTTLPLVVVRVPLLRTDVSVLERTRVPAPVRVRTLELFTPTLLPPTTPLRVELE